MGEQRPDPGVDSSHSSPSRRRLLRSFALFAAGALAGCSGVRGGTEPVSLLVAGSLNNAAENGLEAAVDGPLRVEAHGSARLARMIAAGQKDPHIASVADGALFRGPLEPRWYAEFATNAVVLAYDPNSEGGRRIDAAGTEEWYAPLQSGEVDLGRTDPDLDPLGYRTRFALELASRYYDAPDLLDRLIDGGEIYPETQLLAALETGSIDAAFTYRSMALDRDYAFVELPNEINLSDPTLETEWYATTDYELPDGTMVEGSVIRYASALRRETELARTVFETHISGDYLEEFGFTVPEQYPRFRGDVPDGVR